MAAKKEAKEDKVPRRLNRAVGLTEALRGHELVSAREFLAEGGAA